MDKRGFARVGAALILLMLTVDRVLPKRTPWMPITDLKESAYKRKRWKDLKTRQTHEEDVQVAPVPPNFFLGVTGFVFLCISLVWRASGSPRAKCCPTVAWSGGRYDTQY